jgi:protease YdgD
LCTGTLVAPDIVITAAHCVVDPWKGVPYPLKDIHFLAGVRGATREGHAVAKCLRFGADTNFGHRNDGSGLARTGPSVSAHDLKTDAVALILDRELAAAPAPLADVFAGAPGLELIHAAYPADRRHQLTAHMNCRLLRTEYEGWLWFNDCDTHPASSGGPVFITKDGVLQLAAIMVASGRRTENVALPISEWRHLVADNRCPSSSGS